MRVEIPELALVVLVGPNGSGKSTFAKRHFQQHEVLSIDKCKEWVSGDKCDPNSTSAALKLLHFATDLRLQRSLLTVVDATNISAVERKDLIAIAKHHDCLAIAIIFDLPTELCMDRNANGQDRPLDFEAISTQKQMLIREHDQIRREGFRSCYLLTNQEQVNDTELIRSPLDFNKKSESGPFDIIGDLHGCCDELEELLDQLGYQPVSCTKPEGSELYLDKVLKHPQGRKAIFVGDYVDRGPRSLDTLRLVATMNYHGHAFCLPGNHDVKLLRKLHGRNVQIKHGLAETLDDFGRLSKSSRDRIEDELKPFIDGLASHLIFDDGKLLVAHAGLKLQYHGKSSGRVREFCLYGDTTGKFDAYGLPIRLNWAKDYRGDTCVVYGHTPVASPEWVNNTVNIDTGCVFGGKLTALRYPEREFIAVPARRTYCEPSRPFQ